jgi:hypothetical protein
MKMWGKIVLGIIIIFFILFVFIFARSIYYNYKFNKDIAESVVCGSHSSSVIEQPDEICSCSGEMFEDESIGGTIVYCKGECSNCTSDSNN